MNEVTYVYKRSMNKVLLQDILKQRDPEEKYIIELIDRYFGNIYDIIEEDNDTIS